MGLLDSIDLEELAKKVLASYQAKDDKAPLSQGLLSAGLGILAANNGRSNGWQAIGQGGMQGLQAYQQGRQAQQKDPAQLIATLSGISGLQQQAEAAKWMQQYNGQPVPQQPSYGMQDRSEGMMPPPQTAAQGATPDASFIMRGMGLPGQAGAMAKAAYEAMTKQPTKVGPGDIPMTLNPRTLQWEPGKQIPNLEKGQEIAGGVVQNQPGYAESVAAVEGAKAGATARANAALDVISVPDGRGGTISLPRAKVVELLSGQAPQPQAESPDYASIAGLKRTVASAPLGDAPVSEPEWVQSIRRGINGALGHGQSKAEEARQVAEATLPTDQAKALAADAYKTQLSDLKESFKTATAAKGSLAAINESRAALDDPAIVGGLAKSKIEALNIVNGLLPSGAQIAPEMLGNSQRLAASLGTALVEHAKALGSNPSNADAKRLEKVIGDEGLSEKGIRAILDFQEKQARNAIENHNRIAKQAAGKGASPLFDYTVEAPEAYKRTQAAQPQTAPPNDKAEWDGKNWIMRAGNKRYRWVP